MNLRTTFVIRLWEAFKQALGRTVRAALLGLIVGFVGIELLAILLNSIGESRFAIHLGWPPSVSLAPTSAFVHVVAILFALMLAYLLGFTVAVKETFHGLVYAAEHVDDAIGAVANEGLNLADAVVDAVDGPNRHGFTGRRTPAEAQRQTANS
ncbi:MAG TPA: hypothetical protein VFX31_04935 [Ktedonobacterales bacterium]|jgi:hypothetical protein|nr:hypothetical protein [Ktedonobacterales bacterium]HEX5570709.1 hypothetical protein [Ktedonobacterales bacterium]